MSGLLIFFFLIYGKVVGGTGESRENPTESGKPYAHHKNNFVEKHADKSIWQIKFLQSRWSFHMPVTEQSHNLPQCKLQHYNWINGSLSHVKYLRESQLSNLFNTHSSTIDVPFSWRRQPFHLTTKTHSDHQLRLHDCYVLFIFSTSCPFSKASVPYVNALARAYPQLPIYGVSVEDYLHYKWSLRMLFVPKLKIIVNGKVFSEYSGSDVDLEQMVEFIWSNMRLLPRVPLHILSVDHKNTPEFSLGTGNYVLIFCWLITIFGFGYIFVIFIQRFEWFTYFLQRVLHTRSLPSIHVDARQGDRH
ncbi:unnamed protein product [Trichobilharzia szidati]|nr:unnamed protein product [Trichobilharzia szidati]